jgi:hypothetical protein
MTEKKPNLGKREELKKKCKVEEAKKEKGYQEEAQSREVIDCLYNHFKNVPKKMKAVCD